MNRTRIIALSVFAALSLAGCSNWKESVHTKKQTEMLYTGMVVDKAHALAVGRSGVTRYSNDGGQRWLAGTNSSMCLYGCNALDENTLYATGNKRQVIFSTNGGDKWVHASEIGGTAPLGKSISFSSPQNGFVSSKRWLGITTDGGKTWTEINLPKGASMIETVCSTGPAAGYMVSELKDIFRTADGGQRWEKLSSPYAALTVKFKPLFCLDNQGVALYVKGDKGVLASVGTVEKQDTLLISETSDGGKTWAKPELHKLKKIPRSVSISPKGYVSVFNKDLTITGFTR
ncbi:MAG TPA: YCF48-related protein [Treponemataceae bacterium]|nr:YCF48-related protein [Treponemataceae bacterium]